MTQRAAMNRDPLTDDELLARLRQGDGDAFEEAVDRHLPALHAFCALHAPAPAVAEDIVRETFVFARRNIRSLARGTPLLDWLCALAAGFLRTEIQRLRREPNLSRAKQLHLRELPELPVAPADEMRRFSEALESLPPDLRELLDRAYAKDQSATQTADALGKRPDWVRLALFRLRRELLRRTLATQPAPEGCTASADV